MSRDTITRKSRPGQNPWNPLQEVLDEYEDRALEAFNEITPVLAEILLAAVQDVFEAEGIDPPWPELADSTLAKRRGDVSQGVKILQDTGVLAASIGREWTPDSATVFTNVPYGKFHVTGTRFMPERDFFAVDEDLVLFESAEALLDQISRGAP